MGSWWRTLFRPLSVKKKLLLWLPWALLSIYLFYVLIGAPAFSARQGMRRIERANLVGPGKVLTYLEDTGYYALEEKNGVALIGSSGGFHYAERAETVTMIPVYDNFQGVYIYAFDEVPEAATAEISITVHEPKWGLERRVYAAAAEREHKGLFVFYLVCQDDYDGDDAHGEWRTLGTFSPPTLRDGHDPYGFPVTVTFYDAAGELITTVETVF